MDLGQLCRIVKVGVQNLLSHVFFEKVRVYLGNICLPKGSFILKTFRGLIQNVKR